MHFRSRRSPPPRVVGVDEYATRKGRLYGTVLVDVETRRPVVLLPDREALSLATWLAQRPGIEVVCRDRAPFFAEGATAGAPQAVQVADRWHLWHNLSEAAERSIAQHRRCLRVLVPQTPETPEAEPGPVEESPGSPWPTGHRFADRTRTIHSTVHAPGGGRAQPSRDPTPARHDEPNRQTVRRRRQAGRPLHRSVADPGLRPR
ncbi:transposase [Streptomyces sp. NPDC004647]|uniref:transposase n=1 Tax=Streptomyces sp. NPDC004647 TaxID=3154671 RepID=UPI0033A0D164